jgi:hypothetical protein
MKASKTSQQPAAASIKAMEAPATAMANWALPKAPPPPAQAKAHVLANAYIPRLVRVCYLKGPEDSFVAARGNTGGSGNVATRIYLGSCANIGGTDIEIVNPNSVPVSGTFEVVAVDAWREKEK